MKKKIQNIVMSVMVMSVSGSWAASQIKETPVKEGLLKGPAAKKSKSQDRARAGNNDQTAPANAKSAKSVKNETKTKSAMSQKGPDWAVNKLSALADRDPKKFFRLVSRLYSKKRLQRAANNPKYAFDWQHRLAALQVLTRFLVEPESPKTTGQKAHFNRTLKILEVAMIDDPSLLVRDGAVEVIRRSIHLYPVLANHWQPRLEKAFLDTKNENRGEGLFIRETILSSMRDLGMKPSANLMAVARGDKNAQVRKLASAPSVSKPANAPSAR